MDKARHGPILEEFFEKNPKTLQAAMEIFEHRLNLKEVVGSIQATSPPTRRWERAPLLSNKWELKRTETKQGQGNRERGG